MITREVGNGHPRLAGWSLAPCNGPVTLEVFDFHILCWVQQLWTVTGCMKVILRFIIL